MIASSPVGRITHGGASHNPDRMLPLELRCPQCHKLLGKASGRIVIEIKCPRCRCLSTFNLDTRPLQVLKAAVLTRQDAPQSTFL